MKLYIAAAIYSLVGSVKLNGLEPEHHLRYVLNRIEELLPWNVAAELAAEANDCFTGPGVRIGTGAVIGARSTALRDMAAGWVCVGYPCKPVRERRLLP